MKVTICSSIYFAKDVLKLKLELEKLGHAVTIPNSIEKYAREEIKHEDKWTKIKGDVIRKYFQVIKKSDAILVLNKNKNGIKNYIGGSVLMEIAFAHVLHKNIFLLNPIPKDLSYSDEIAAMKPRVINCDLKKININ